MKKVAIWATACFFTLSLSGAALGQREEKATEVNPPLMEAPSAAPVEKPRAPESVKKTDKKKTQAKAKKQSASKKSIKKKKAKPAKKTV